jgi:hypothetical protein
MAEFSEPRFSGDYYTHKAFVLVSGKSVAVANDAQEAQAFCSELRRLLDQVKAVENGQGDLLAS